MPRHIAFLRAVNVGGRNVRMEPLRRLFASFGFDSVETYIASGNVVFRSRMRSTEKIERKIEAGLRKALGYEVATVVRTDVDLARLAAHEAFPPADVAAAQALSIVFLREAPTAAQRRALATLRTEFDDFTVDGRQVHWLSRRKQSESTFSKAALERAFGADATIRSVKTIRRMAAKWSPDK